MRSRFLFILFLFIFAIKTCVEAQIITTYVGGGTGGLGDGGLATFAKIGITGGIAFDHFNNLYIADGNYNRVRKVDGMTGIISTVAGNGNGAFSGDSGLAVQAELRNPLYIAIDSSNNLYVSDVGNNRVRKIDISTGIITTIAGNGNTTFSGDSILAINTSLWGPQGLAFDHLGNLYISDLQHFRIRKINPLGIITTVAGNGTQGFSGDSALATNAQLRGVYGICIDSIGNVYMADWANGSKRVRKLTISSGIITTFAGNGVAAYDTDGLAATSVHLNPIGITLDHSGNLIIADYSNERVRKVDSMGIIHTIVGHGITGFGGDNQIADSALLSQPEGVAFDTCGNLFIADSQNKRIRKVMFHICTGDTTSMINNPYTAESAITYPNPSKGVINIFAPQNIVNVTILNIFGKVLHSKEYNATKILIDISNYSSGIYYLQITDKNGNKEVKKILNQ